MTLLRRILLLTALTVALSAATVVVALWARSLDAQDLFVYTTTGDRRVPQLRTWIVRSSQGTLSVERVVTRLDKLPSTISPVTFEKLHARWDAPEPLRALHVGRPPAPSPAALLTEPTLRGWYRLGFGCIQNRVPTYQSQDNFYVPHWAAVLAALGLPACVLARRVRKRRRMRAGVCPGCGYDLRASPERCPECGTAAAATPPIPRAGPPDP